MVVEADMEEFFTGGRWAVVGVSRDPDKYGYIVHRRLRGWGEEVYPVNPNIEEVEGETCYATLADLPESVDQIVIVVPPRKTEQVVAQAAKQGILRIWMQPGAESTKAVNYCRDKGITVISGRCILRYMDQMETRPSRR